MHADAPSERGVPVEVTPRRASGTAGTGTQGLLRGATAGRDLSDKAFYSSCYAPHTSLYFEQHGGVRACCQNITGTLGNIRSSSIREIWDGVRTAALRAALESDDLTRGCSHCAWEDAHGDGDIRFSRTYDIRPVAEHHPRYPKQMEFALSNGCNLQCQMCTGWNSSAIRAHREHLPPIDVPYGDAFFEELAEFLPHLDRAIVLGGEPFVARESLRLLDLFAELDGGPEVRVITNATQWSPRIQRYFERIPLSVDLSIDAITKETFEAIRIGARFEDVMANVERYAAGARANGLSAGIAFCLMSNNWHEFADLLAYAEQQELDHVSVNLVTAPRRFSLYRLERHELAQVVEQMEGPAGRAAEHLQRFRPVWDAQLEALRSRVEGTSSDGRSTVPGSAPWNGGRGDAVEACIQDLRAFAGHDPVVIRADEDLHVIEVSGPAEHVVGPQVNELFGQPVQGVLELAAARHGGSFAQVAASTARANEFSFEGVADGVVRAQVRCFLFHDDRDLLVLLAHRATG